MRSLLSAGVLAAAMLFSGAVSAVPVNVSETQPITADGQSFDFTFLNTPPSGGVAGQMFLTLQGDYSLSGDDELATLTLTGAVGQAVFGDGADAATSFVDNSIAGLTLNSFALTTFDGNNKALDYVFDVSATLLAAIAQSGQILASIVNSDGVTATNSTDAVTLGFEYETSAVVPAPLGLPLLLTGIGVFAVASRLRRR